MIWRPPEGFRKDVAFSPAYDRRHWPGNFGIHGVDLWLALIGPKGAVEFRVFTNWFLPQVEEKLAERMRRGEPIGNPFEPDAAGFWYDARQPLEGWPEPEPCPSCGWLDGDPCYHYMGDVVPSMDLLSDLIAQGEEKFWQGMMREYERVFMLDGATVWFPGRGTTFTAENAESAEGGAGFNNDSP